MVLNMPGVASQCKRHADFKVNQSNQIVLTSAPPSSTSFVRPAQFRLKQTEINTAAACQRREQSSAETLSSTATIAPPVIVVTTLRSVHWRLLLIHHRLLRVRTLRRAVGTLLVWSSVTLVVLALL